MSNVAIRAQERDKSTDSISMVGAVGCDYEIPPIHVHREDDGSFGLEWIFKNVRIGLSIGPNPGDHGWYVISKTISGSGPLELDRGAFTRAE